MKINKDYFYLSSDIDRMRYFFGQGNVVAHTIDRFKWHIFPKFHIAPGFPTHIDIEAASICQLKCPMCTQCLMDKSSLGVMDFSLYKKIIDECAKRGVYSIKLSWRGEPLLNPRIVDMVAYAKKKGIKDVAFLSNGERLNDRLTEELIRAGLDWISISIDGLDRTYDSIRYPSKFKDIVRKVKKIRETRERLGTESLS